MSSELFWSKVYKSQIPVIEQAIETAARMLGSDKSRVYCLEMICADFLAGAHMDNGDPQILLYSISRYYRFLPEEQKNEFLSTVNESGVTKIQPKTTRVKLDPKGYADLHRQVLERDNWRCKMCGSMRNLEVHHIQFRSHFGADVEHNLLTLCTTCHGESHRRRKL